MKWNKTYKIYIGLNECFTQFVALQSACALLSPVATMNTTNSRWALEHKKKTKKKQMKRHDGERQSINYEQKIIIL